MTVYENIVNGVYENSMEYPKAPNKPSLSKDATPAEIRAYADAVENYETASAAYKEARIAYNNEASIKLNQFRADLECEYGTAGHPKAGALWELAWVEGNSSGLRDVLNWYDRLSELVVWDV